MLDDGTLSNLNSLKCEVDCGYVVDNVVLFH